jgi:DNA-binding NarL/FixJ family response regulator
MTTTIDSAPTRTARRAIRVFIAEDHAITLWGLRGLIDAAPSHMEVVGSARSRAELMNDPAAAEADVILLDLDLGGEDMGASLSALRQRCPGRVLVLTASDDTDAHRSVVIQGARGVVHKSQPADVILRAIEKVHGGEAWLHRTLLGEVLGLLTDSGPTPAQRKADPATQRIASLTPRERKIVETLLHSSGAKQLAIAESLGISEHTLRNHLTTIYSKLAVRGRLELHVFATAQGLGATRPENIGA